MKRPLRNNEAAFKLKEGFNNLERNDYEAANACFKKAMEINPNYVQLYLDEAIKSDPSDAEAYYKRGMVRKSVEDLSEAIRLNPKHVHAYFNRGVARHYNLRDLDGAIADYDRVLELDQSNKYASKFRALAVMMKKDQEPPSQLSRTEELYRAAASVEDNLAINMSRSPQVFEDALVDIFELYLQILGEKPSDEIALARLYRVALLVKASPSGFTETMSRVRNHYNERLSKNPGDAQACVRICQIEKIIHGTEKATGMTWAQEALKRDRGNSDAYLEFAYYYEGRNELAKAKFAIDRAIELDPRNADAHAAKGMLLANQGNMEDGVAEYARCLELDQTHLQAKAIIVTLLAQSMVGLQPNEVSRLRKLVGL